MRHSLTTAQQDTNIGAQHTRKIGMFCEDTTGLGQKKKGHSFS